MFLTELYQSLRSNLMIKLRSLTVEYVKHANLEPIVLCQEKIREIDSLQNFRYKFEPNTSISMAAESMGTDLKRVYVYHRSFFHTNVSVLVFPEFRVWGEVYLRERNQVYSCGRKPKQKPIYKPRKCAFTPATWMKFCLNCKVISTLSSARLALCQAVSLQAGNIEAINFKTRS